jgi:rare lipoprotein A
MDTNGWRTIRNAVILLICFVLTLHDAQAKSDKYQAKASWYQSGSITADGSKYDPDGYSVAHKTLPFGTIVILTNPLTGKTIWAVVNDRGPFIEGREFDVSRGAAIALGFFHSGVAKLLIQVLEKEKKNGRNVRQVPR